MNNMKLLVCIFALLFIIYSSTADEIKNVDHIEGQSAANNDSSERAFVMLGGRLYYFDTSISATWNEARTFCHSIGMFLASVETAEENTLLVNHIMTVTGVGNYWMSGNDIDRTMGDFVWDTTGQRVIYTDFHSGFPVDVPDTCLGYYWINNILKWKNYYPDTAYNVYTICEEA